MEKSALTQSEEEKMSWLRQILEWQRDMSDNKEFLSLLKSDLGFVFRKRVLLYSRRRCKDTCQTVLHRLILLIMSTVQWEIKW